MLFVTTVTSRKVQIKETSFFSFHFNITKLLQGFIIKRQLCNVYVTRLVLEHSYTEAFLRVYT